jgi:hypothetical protein
MKKLVIITCLVAVLIGGLVGGGVLAATTPPAGPVMMDGGGGNLTVAWVDPLCDCDSPQFTSPQYNQVRHISVTLYANPLNSGDTIQVRAWLKDSKGAAHIVPVLKLNSCTEQYGTIEFDATRWEIYGTKSEEAGSNITVYFAYTTTYPNLQNRQ